MPVVLTIRLWRASAGLFAACAVVLCAERAHADALPAATSIPAESADHARELIRQYLQELDGQSLAVLVFGAALLLALWWAVWMLSLKLATWFALVESTYKQCAVLAAFLMCASALACSTLFGLWVPLKAGNAAFILCFVALCLTATAILIQRSLQCRWRSVVTILVMTNVSYYLVLAGFLALALGGMFVYGALASLL